MTQRGPFCKSKTSPEVIGPAVLLCVRFRHSPRNIGNLLHGGGIEVAHEAVHFW